MTSVCVCHACVIIVVLSLSRDCAFVAAVVVIVVVVVVAAVVVVIVVLVTVFVVTIVFILFGVKDFTGVRPLPDAFEQLVHG